ncbi:MAG TPA: GTP-binding protein, partial [Planctomycetota bacterium]|nr:GTP-binding protein [Planctomycetota bacterium]
MFDQSKLRNIAIIAHVDHGKTTLVDGLLKQSGMFRDNQATEVCMMDSNALERERGITILAKNCSLMYKGVKINVIDTPGHADFGGEVERVLKMADGVLLLVDAFDGPMPQTRFVLKKALGHKLQPILVVNKIDRPEARPLQVVDEVLDLFIDLGADEHQLDFPVVFASGRQGVATLDMKVTPVNLEPLYRTILEKVPAPSGGLDKPFQMLVSNIDYSSYTGRIAIGRVFAGQVKTGQQAALMRHDGSKVTGKVIKIEVFTGMGKQEVTEANAGDIIALTGLEESHIGETIADVENGVAMEYVSVDEPTISMNFMVNTSPFAGMEGKFVTSRLLSERLDRELKSNVALRVERTKATDSFCVSGRGLLHLSILIETMRREGFELAVSKPQVILKEVDGQTCEPVEWVVVDCPEEYAGKVIELLGMRKGAMESMATRGNLAHIEFKC